MSVSSVVLYLKAALDGISVKNLVSVMRLNVISKHVWLFNEQSFFERCVWNTSIKSRKILTI